MKTLTWALAWLYAFVACWALAIHAWAWTLRAGQAGLAWYYRKSERLESKK